MMDHSSPVIRSSFLLILLLFAGMPAFRSGPRVFAQSPTTEKPKLKKFGSSLNRIKWDKVRQSGIELESSKNDSSEDVVRINTDLVVSDVMVHDRNGLVIRGLTADDFVLREDGQEQSITHFSLGSDVTVPRSIVLIMDYSGSLRSYIDLTVNAAKTLVDKLGPKDRMAIVTANVELPVDFTADKTKLKKGLESLKVYAQLYPTHSRQFSALLATARELFDEEDIRPIIIFQTDGDQRSALQPRDPSASIPASLRQEFSLADVYAATERSRATVYTVIPGLQLIGLPEANQFERAKIDLYRFMISNGYGGDYASRQPWHPSQKQVELWLKQRTKDHTAVAQVAELTGGFTNYLEQPEQAATIYDHILRDINDRYVIGYYPTNKLRDGKRRQVLIEIRNHPEYEVMGRRSYIASTRD